jgi:hypothetical protein
MSRHQIEKTVVISDQKYITIMIPVESLLPQKEEQKPVPLKAPLTFKQYQKYANELYYEEIRELTFDLAKDDYQMKTSGARSGLRKQMRMQNGLCYDCFEEVILKQKEVAFASRDGYPSNYEPEYDGEERDFVSCETCRMAVRDLVMT